ncbi:flagellar filament capping protein FliD [Gallionella capsiferriformans]|uniref:Flagellar hook-associated protein 2 n=1 Tax=Gallionella capsiferriformans (strain ES-2) TaxID=395494 RepID=D9SF10_GALCS|nr:flagellar filament capping protein FliD [Gallionella capsiferriformans]ADL55107.1 flagellar hook-associated 2 domain-containing protein [Gallionella capsiferriformans ES-2]
MVTATTTSTSGSSIDVNTIVSSLMAVERLPVNRLNTQQTSYQAKISTYGTMQSQMASFQTAAAALGSSSSSSLLAFKTSSSDTGVLTASASSTAVAGTYALNVTSLAQSQNLVSAGQASSTTAISDGTSTTINFDFGTLSGGTLTGGVYTSPATFTSNGTATQSITIDSSNNTLQGISDAINAANIGMTATIVNDGSSSPYRLTLTSTATGISNSVKISTSGGDGTLDTLLANDPTGLPAAQHMNQTVAAQNSNFTVNGIAITNTSNTVTNAMQGVTLNLNTISAAPVTLTIARDTTAVSTAVSNFVSAYNSMYSMLQTASAYKSGSPLAGDPTLRDLQTQMRGIAAGAVTGGTLSAIGDAGISFTAAGVMQLDSAKLSTALSNNYSAVANLFNSSTGFATSFENMAKNTLAFDGAFANRTASLNQAVKSNNDRIGVMEANLANIEKRYRAQYSSLNVMLAEMGKTSSYLTQQLSRL